jgi:hypothetical protein
MVALVATIHVFFLPASKRGDAKEVVDGRPKADHDDLVWHRRLCEAASFVPDASLSRQHWA